MHCDLGYIYRKCYHSETKLAASTECAAPLSHSLKNTDIDIGVLVVEKHQYWKVLETFFSQIIVLKMAKSSEKLAKLHTQIQNL